MSKQTKILIVRIKKSFRRYRKFWYNGQAGTIYFVIDRDNRDYQLMQTEEREQSGVKVRGPEPGGYFLLKRHCEVIGKL